MKQETLGFTKSDMANVGMKIRDLMQELTDYESECDNETAQSHFEEAVGLLSDAENEINQLSELTSATYKKQLK